MYLSISINSNIIADNEYEKEFEIWNSKEDNLRGNYKSRINELTQFKIEQNAIK
ncbi:hypothetical protein [Clostridium ihumii]|uniref:hypothetical protein n=1 Tax=Clostridium ihumii TaxID=1470356 RepID=UPI000B29379F|nr:hypothetical protein [Clostridium ihumii]